MTLTRMLSFSWGGANIIDKVRCENKIGVDYNADLISLLQYIQDDPLLQIAPKDCSFEHYADVRENRKQNKDKYSKEYTALIGYCASYGGRYFDGGYGRDSRGGRSHYRECLNNLRAQAPNLKGIQFLCMDYKSFDISKYKNALFYLDPPYRDTKKYALNIINYEHFYQFCRELSRENIVLISEKEMPDDFVCIWERKRKVLQDSNRTCGKLMTEKLFMVKGGISVE